MIVIIIYLIFIIYICDFVTNKNYIIKRFIYPFIIVLIASCNTISTAVSNGNTNSNITEQRVNFINSYTSNIDFKSNDTIDYHVNDLKINGHNRIINTNESKKDVVLKNKSIVKVKLNDHLYHNFIKSKSFYYNNDQLVCVKLVEILPNQLNEPTLTKRTIYIHNNRVIADSSLSKLDTHPDEFVNLGKKYLKHEYQTLQ